MEVALTGANWIAARLASDPSTTIEVLRRLAMGGDLRVCLGTVVNRATPPAILEKLTEDHDPVVRTASALFLERRGVLAAASEMRSHKASAVLSPRNR